MELFKELKKIDQYIGFDTDKFSEYYSYLVVEYPSRKEKKLIDDYIESSLRNFTVELGKDVEEISLRMQQIEVSLLETIA